MIVRIHNPDPRTWGHPYVVAHPGDPRVGRGPKDYVLRLDADGYTYCDEKVWQRLEEARAFTNHTLVFVNVVEKGPKQIIGMQDGFADDEPSWFRQEREFLREIAPPGTRARVTRPKPLRR